ncbi:hypothetical protein CCUS01_01635 [Colletotrichum cuscutae]|uniref:Uncharacterized protein n=1 Tax=Colletotrichum cuscutae TaxID=1209917 RepID=A0AAI9XR40_9PEZI|nr:hypothetical protein CCUS01_01635 [Colletotrichum cuscutae]
MSPHSLFIGGPLSGSASAKPTNPEVEPSLSRELLDDMTETAQTWANVSRFAAGCGKDGDGQRQVCQRHRTRGAEQKGKRSKRDEIGGAGCMFQNGKSLAASLLSSTFLLLIVLLLLLLLLLLFLGCVVGAMYL